MTTRRVLSAAEAVDVRAPVVYRLYAEGGGLLYVGKAVDLAARCRMHRRSRAWWPEVATVTTQPCETLEAAAAIELAAIRSEAPRYNRAGIPCQERRAPRATNRRARGPRERDPEVSEAFGGAVRIARVRRRLSQAELAQAARIQPGTVGRIERGEREPILSVAVRIARALGLEPWELLKAMDEERGR